MNDKLREWIKRRKLPMNKKIKYAFKYIKEGKFFRHLRKNRKIKKLNQNVDKYSDEKYLIKLGEIRLNYKMDLENPKTLNEKINYYKLHYKNPLMVQCVDKIAVDEYVKSKGLEYILVPKYAIWNSFDEIDVSNLPDSFVIKTNADSGGVLPVYDKSKFKINDLNKIKKSFGNNYSKYKKEWPYGEVKQKIFAEQYLKDNEHAVPYDYKFFCFNGKVAYLMICTQREKDVKIDFFDRNCNWMNVERCHHRNNKNRPTKPELFDQMIEISEKLANDFPLVRVDLYQVSGKIYFGELTFFSGSGLEKCKTYEQDILLGEPFNIDSIKNSQYYKE